MTLPSREKCFKLMDKYGMYDNIKEHVKMVEKVAVCLAKELKRNNIEIDENLISRAALLHDISKVDEIKGEGKHDEIGERILTKEGYKDLGEFCRLHLFGKEKDLENWEEKVLNYADKRVLHDKIVDLKLRLKDLNQRYALRFNYDEAVKRSLEIEKEIFSNLDIEPEELGNLIN